MNRPYAHLKGVTYPADYVPYVDETPPPRVFGDVLSKPRRKRGKRRLSRRKPAPGGEGNATDQRSPPSAGAPAESALLGGAAPHGEADGIRRTGRALRPPSAAGQTPAAKKEASHE